MGILATVLLIPFIGTAEAMILPESINGLEKSGGELSKFNLELENMEIVSGYITLPNPETWEEMRFDFRNIDAEYTLDGFNFLSQYNKELAFFVTAQHKENGEYDVSVYIKEKDEDVMKLEYWATGEMINYEKPIELSMIIKSQDRANIHRDYNAHIYVTNSEGNIKTNMMVDIYDLSGKFVVHKQGQTSTNGFWPTPIIIKNSDFRAYSCYEGVVTAEYKGVVIQDTFTFRVYPSTGDGGFGPDHYVYEDDRNCFRP